MRTLLSLLVAATVALGSACGSTAESPPVPASSGDSSEPVSYRPIPAEEFPAGKRLAADLAQRALTYDPGTSPRSVAKSLGPSTVSLRSMTKVLKPVVEPGSRSSAEVIYPQLSGVTSVSLGAMVVIRQRLENRDGDTSTVTRTADVRLRLVDGSWALDRISSFGGEPLAEPESVSRSAARVLDNPNIELPDTARWDIYRGKVDDALLDALSKAARNRELAVTVFESGHPPTVWATSRRSAHSAGHAVDIWAVDGVPVIKQRKVGTPAYELAALLIAGGPVQLGSPWVLGSGAKSIVDDAHQDHIHLQQSPLENRS